MFVPPCQGVRKHPAPHTREKHYDGTEAFLSNCIRENQLAVIATTVLLNRRLFVITTQTLFTFKTLLLNRPLSMTSDNMVIYTHTYNNIKFPVLARPAQQIQHACAMGNTDRDPWIVHFELGERRLATRANRTRSPLQDIITLSSPLEGPPLPCGPALPASAN